MRRPLGGRLAATSPRATARKTKFRFSAGGGGENAAPFRKRKMCGLTAEEEGGRREGMSSERGMKMKRLSYPIKITK